MQISDRLIKRLVIFVREMQIETKITILPIKVALIKTR